MTGLLDGKVALITGAASGVGRAIAEHYADEGAAALVLADVEERPREGGPTTAELIGSRTTTRFVRTDVSDRLAIEAAVDVADELGGIDVLVNNAGVFWIGELFDVDEVAYERMMAVNVKGVIFGTQIAATSMRRREQPGSIINLSSVAALQGQPMMALYSATKGAVRSFTYAAARELGPLGIRVNAIHPGLVETSMTRVDAPLIAEDGSSQFEIPLGRNAQPADIAKAAVFLASPLSDYLSASSITVDGALVGIG